MASKSRLFSKLLGSGTSGTIPQTSISSDVSFGVSTYNNISTLPLSGNDIGDQAFVDSDNRLYIWNGSGWYNIALINTSPSITGGYQDGYLFETDGTPIEITLVGNDPEGIPLTWSYEVTSGSLTNGGGTTATVSNVDNVFTITPSTTEDYAGSFSLTFKASDGVNIGTAVSSFTLQFKIINSNYTTLLAKGVAATQNSTFIDSSANNHTITRNGDVYQGTFSPYKKSGYSTYFDGSGDYYTVPDALNLGTNDFTFEFWIWPDEDFTSVAKAFINSELSGTGVGWSFTQATYNGYNGLTFSYGLYGSYTVGKYVDNYWLPQGEWTHIAAQRRNGVVEIYVNGVSQALSTFNQGGTFSDSADLTSSQTLRTFFNGVKAYISDLRLVVGSYVYDGNFTPSTENIIAVTNTKLLTNQNQFPYLVDNSPNSYTITTYGNTSIVPLSRYENEKYNAATNGGSAYFDGTGDYLTFSDAVTVIGNSDFTIEAWVYPIANCTIMSNMPSGTNNNYFSITTTNFQLRDSAGQFILTLPTSVPLNVWSHIVVTRNGNTYTYWINGVSQVSGDSTKAMADRTMHLGAFLYDGYVNYFNGYMSNIRIVKGTAVYTSNFTPPTDPLTEITNTSALLKFTNAGIQDYSQVSDLKTVGNATGSNTQTKYAPYSMYFDGTGDYITLPPSSAFTFGTGDFTIEGWIYLTGLNATANGIFQQATSFFPGSVVNTVAFATLNTSNFQIYAAGAQHNFSPAVVPSLNTWYHFAVVRSSGTTKAYINGTSGISVSDATDYTGTYFGIGNIYGFSGYTQNGYIEDLRITKGLARYTANFTPPTSELLG